MGNRYLVKDEFEVKDGKVIVLDKPYEFGNYHKAVVDEREYEYFLNSIPTWIAIKSRDSFLGKTVSFV